MKIGTGKIDLYIDGCQSLKDKRQIIKSLKTRIRNNFNVSVIEFGDQDLWQRCKIGIVCGALDRAGADSVLNKVVEFLQREKSVSIIDVEKEIR